MLPFKSTSFFDEKYYTENQAGRQIYFVISDVLMCNLQSRFSIYSKILQPTFLPFLFSQHPYLPQPMSLSISFQIKSLPPLS